MVMAKHQALAAMIAPELLADATSKPPVLPKTYAHVMVASLVMAKHQALAVLGV